MQLNEKVIGIVGGMGPQAGSALFESIIRQTTVSSDQQHLPVILMSFPGRLVDRTAFINGETTVNPADNIVAVIEKLEQAGAGIIGIACNTSHSPPIYNSILEGLQQKNSRVTLVHMPYETCRYIKNNYSNVQRIGLMTTNGTYQSGLYKTILQQMGYEVLLPDWTMQQEVIHRMIYHPQYGIKANTKAVTIEVRQLLETALTYFKEKKADAIILGCTELSFVLTEKMVKGMWVVDSTTALAQALIQEARQNSAALPLPVIKSSAPV